MPCVRSGAGSDTQKKERPIMIYAQPGTAGAVVSLKPRYGNYIGGEFVAPVKGQYFVNTSPLNGEVIGECPRSGAEDLEKAQDAAHAADHFRYFAGCIRAQEGSAAEINEHTAAYHFHEPLGVVGQIIPWNFPLLMAAWKLAPALAAGNCVVLKPAEQTPLSIMVFAEII